MKKLLIILGLILLPQFAHADITTGLEAWWKMDEGTGTTAADSGSGGNTGTLVGPTWDTGKIGLFSTLYNGSSDYIDIPTPSYFSDTTGSICMWIYPTSLSGFPVPFNSADTGTSVTYMYYQLNPDSTITFDFRSAGIPIYSFQTDSPIGLNTWTHICWVQDGSGPVFYFNSVATTTTPLYAPNIPGGWFADLVTPNETNIGRFHYGGGGGAGSDYFFGNIDDVRVYGRALSLSDVQELYAYTGIVVSPSATRIPRMTLSKGIMRLLKGMMIIR